MNQGRSDNDALDRCIVQFIHPGGEHGADGEGSKRWNRDLHRRKFLLVRGEYRETPATPPVREKLVVWGEWEPESEVEPIPTPVPAGPRWLHRPYYVRPTGYGGDLQNTDPFVFGDRFLFTLCRQTKPVGGVPRPTFLRDLAVGSLILFGSLKAGEFVLDTVFVVGDSVLHDADDWKDVTRRRVSEAYVDVTLRPSYQTRWPHQLRLYSGATDRHPVDGMFSFAPCLPAAAAPEGFARPAIRHPGVVTPGLMMGAKATRRVPLETVRQVWESVVEQVVDQDLALGVRFDLPRRRER